MSKEAGGDQFDPFEVMNKNSSSKASENGADRSNPKQVGGYGIEDLGESLEAESYFSCLGFSREHEVLADGSLHKSKCHQEELRLLAHVGAMDDLYLDVLSPPFQAFGEDIAIFLKSQYIDSDEDRSYTFPSASLEILKSCRDKIAPVNETKINQLYSKSKEWLTSSSPLSTNQILELAAGILIWSDSATTNELSAIGHPCASSLLGLSTKDGNDVQLVQDLLSCAEKVGSYQYYYAGRLLEQFNKISSSKTSTVQRLVHYFIEALLEKLDRETGKYPRTSKLSLDTITPNSALFALQMKLPVAQVAQFTCIQTMLDHVPPSTNLHIIDLEIRCGVKLMILMQALASRSECPLKHFKLTAVATKSKLVTEDACIRLKSMAESLKLKFSFNVIMLEDIINLQPNLFNLDVKEAVIVHAAYILQSMIPRPYQLEVLIRAIKKTNPCVMIITEAEANINSPIFVNRFVEALFFYGAYFDCMEDCLKDDSADRTSAESYLFSPAIRSIVGADGEDRNIRSVGINIWREFFSGFGMVETDLSKLAPNHANLIRTSVTCGDSCTLDLNGKSLIVGWKGTPICSLSAWKFQRPPVKSISKSKFSCN